MNSVRYIFIVLLLFICDGLVIGQQIFLDDTFDDWKDAKETFFDLSGDVPAGFIDFSNVSISNDDRYLFVYFKINKEINIQENNDITLYIDLDNNENTGRKVNGIGAEIIYNFGKRQGFLYSGDHNYLIYHNHISLVTSPTVTSDKFELAIARKFTYNNETIQMHDEIRIALSDEINRGDKAPDYGGYTYQMNRNIQFVSEYTIEKKDPDLVRIMTYNVLNDRLFNGSVRQNYHRIFKAINPDIIGFCEIYDKSSAQVASLIEEFLPSKENEKWYHASGNPDIRMISRYPIINVRSIDGNAAFLIDLGKEKLVAIVAHLPCCNNEIGRQAEVDNIMAFIRGVKYGISPFQVPVNSPIIIMGDMNFVGLRQQFNTIIKGDIVNNGIYGPSFKPDWDNNDLADLKPITTGMPMSFTWNNSNGTYSAGRLDYMIYSSSVMQSKNSYALWTQEMSISDLNTNNLQRNDVSMASDHTPIIGDFKIDRVTATIEKERALPVTFQNRNGLWYINAPEKGRLILTDIAGRILVDMSINKIGEQIIDLPALSGLFILSFETMKGVYSEKIFR